MWLPGKRRLWKYYVIRKRSHNYGAFAPFFLLAQNIVLRGPMLVGLFSSDTGPKIKPPKGGLYFWWRNHPQKIFLRGPILVGLFSSDTGPKIKPPKRWFLSLVAKSPTKNIFFAGPDAGRTLLVRHRAKNKTTQKVVYISGGEITHKKYFFAGPDTGRTLLVRRRTKNKTTQKVVFIFGGPGRTRTDTPCRT